jgi:MFS family permease
VNEEEKPSQHSVLPPQGGRGLARGFSSLRHRNYRLFWGGQIVSLIGTWMQTVAQGWLVLTLSDSAFVLGLVGALQFLPVLLFSLFGGVVADRFPKRTILLATQTSAALLALTLGLLTVTGLVEVWHVMVLAFFLGTVNSLDMPARQSFVVEMVGKDDLLNAIALNSSAFNGARIVGPAVAALLIAQIGIAACFLCNAISYVAVITGLLLMDTNVLSHVEAVRGQSVWRHVREGLGYVRRTRDVATAITLIGVISLFGMNFNTLNPLFAREVLDVGATGYGLLMSAMGVGSLAAAVSLAFFGQRASRLLIVGAALGLALFELAFSFSKVFPLSLLLLVGAGLTATTFMASSNSLVQTTTPDGLRGRVMGVYALVFVGVTPFGSFYAGALAQLWGAPLTMGLSAALCGIGGALAILSRWHRQPSPVEPDAPS